MLPRVLRPVLSAAALALAACSGGDQPEESAETGLNVTTSTTTTANTAETAPAAAPPPSTPSVDDRRASYRDVRDGPGEDRAPEYEGARSAATALPSAGDDATTTDAVPPPPPPAPGTPQNVTTER